MTGTPESDASGAASGVRFVAIGDSFTEGVGDERDDGAVRGWADLVAQGWAHAIAQPISYANLAIRGKLIDAIVAEQLEPALALRPTHLSFNGGGNDMLRPRSRTGRIADAFVHVVERCRQENVRLIALSGANPSRGIPLGALVQHRGDLLADAVIDRLPTDGAIVTAFNWPDATLADRRFWSADRLHMNARGHHRVAARVLTALELPAPPGWWDLPGEQETVHLRATAYYREHVAPWVRRRVNGTSSGDGRLPKIAAWARVSPGLL